MQFALETIDCAALCENVEEPQTHIPQAIKEAPAREIMLDKETATTLFQQGKAAFENQNWRNAAKLFERALVLYPEDDNILYNLGLTYQYQGSHLAATAAFNKALLLKPDDEGIKNALQNIPKTQPIAITPKSYASLETRRHIKDLSTGLPTESTPLLSRSGFMSR